MEQDELVFALCVSHTAQAYGSNQLPTDRAARCTRRAL